MLKVFDPADAVVIDPVLVIVTDLVDESANATLDSGAFSDAESFGITAPAVAEVLD